VTPAWRIVKERYAGEAFTGEGARLYGGRWSRRGHALVYTSDTLSLAALEYFVHLGPAMAGLELVSFRVEIPKRVTIETMNKTRLPAGWRDIPPPLATRQFGADCAAEQRTAVLRAPSALIPEQHNLILNPAHPEFKKIRIHQPDPFRFDSRMWK
jgi:RES domain-containing protein